MENMPEFQPYVLLYNGFFEVHFKNMIHVNKSSANTISNKLNILPKKDENCDVVSIRCIVSRCGKKTLMAVCFGGRRKPMSPVVASERKG